MVAYNIIGVESKYTHREIIHHRRIRKARSLVFKIYREFGIKIGEVVIGQRIPGKGSIRNYSKTFGKKLIGRIIIECSRAG